ncbi:hypothetical protein D3C81_1544710 [compost metagenome]
MPVNQKEEFREEQHHVQTISRAIKKDIVEKETTNTNAMISKDESKNQRIKNMSTANQDERNKQAKEDSWLAEEIKEAYEKNSEITALENSQVNSSARADTDVIDEFMIFTQNKWGEMK